MRPAARHSRACFTYDVRTLGSSPTHIILVPKGGKEEQNHKLRHDDNTNDEEDNEDDNNNHKIRHSTDRIAKSKMKSNHTSSTDMKHHDPVDDNWMKGSWCWVPI